MKITFARVKNYKSLRDSGEISFGDRYTVVVGQNNSGKTAFLEALNPHTFRVLPHRTPQKGAFPTVPNPHCEIDYGLSMSGRELEFAFKLHGAQYHVPVPHDLNGPSAEQFIRDLFARDRIDFRIAHTAGGGWTARYPSHRLFNVSGNRQSVRVDISPDRQGWTISGPIGGDTDSFPDFLGGLLTGSEFYGFRAERMNIGRCKIEGSPDLKPNADNLPSVLLQLPRKHHAHEQYQDFVREIFPSVFRVGAHPVSRDDAGIEIVMNDMEAGARRAGINVPLDESGTGVGQVLAILYVVVTADFPRIIAIDEPNSFLHPGAAKKLLTILKQFDHQYIISTHSAELIRVADPEFLHLVEWDKTESRFQSLDRKNLDDQRRLLREIGVHLSDVFGADSILWVEGPTEERCFPILLEHLELSSPAVSIVSVVATDDLTGKRPRVKLAWEVYRKLSTGSALVPPALSFSLDREGRSPKEIQSMTEDSRGKVNFLPRRTYENYLIDDEAISQLLTAEAGQPVPIEKIRDWISAHKEDRAYLDNPPAQGVDWAHVVDAPKLLYDLFNAMTDAKVEYQKTHHSVELTKWLLAKKPNSLTELFDYLKELVPSH